MPRIAFSCAFVVALLARPVVASEPDANLSLAKQFFDKAVQRMEAGKCDAAPVGDESICREARELLVRAYDLYPAALGALRNLGRVERSLGLYASAIHHFRELARKAPADPKKARQLWGPLARKEIDAIEPLLSYVTVKPTDTALEGLTVRLDGATLPLQAFDVKLEIDAGEHLVEAEARGRTPFHAMVLVRPREGQTVVVRLDPSPRNESLGVTAPASNIGPRPAPSGAFDAKGTTTALVAPDAPPSSRGSSRVAPLVVAGTGVVGVAVGLGLGWVAIDKRKAACGDSALCEPTTFESGKAFANASTIVTSIGAAALVGGGLWYFLGATSAKPATTARLAPAVSSSFWGLHASGVF